MQHPFERLIEIESIQLHCISPLERFIGRLKDSEDEAALAENPLVSFGP
jgi:hypothetical protein